MTDTRLQKFSRDQVSGKPEALPVRNLKSEKFLMSVVCSLQIQVCN